MWMKTCFHSHFYANFHASVTLLFLFGFSWDFRLKWRTSSKKLGMIYTIFGSFCSFLNWEEANIRLQIRPKKIPECMDTKHSIIKAVLYLWWIWFNLKIGQVYTKVPCYFCRSHPDELLVGDLAASQGSMSSSVRRKGELGGRGEIDEFLKERWWTQLCRLHHCHILYQVGSNRKHS